MNQHPWQEDFRELESTTNRDRPALEDTMRAARNRRPAPSREGLLMSTIRSMKGRPWLAAGVAGSLAVLAMLVIPISYQRTTGYRVAVSLSGPNLEMETVAGIAQQMKSLLQVEHVRLEAQHSGAGPRFELSASVPAKSGEHATAVARGFAGELGALGYAASAKAEPIREQVSGNVYAFARDRVIEIHTDGKSASQLETEIRQKLAEAGIANTQVSVTGEGTGDDHRLKVKIESKQQSFDPKTAAEAEHVIPRLVLQRNGAPIEGNAFSVEARKMKRHDGALTLVFEVTQDSRKATATVADANAKTDDAIRSEVESQLRQAGLDVIVTVTAGEVEVKPGKP